MHAESVSPATSRVLARYERYDRRGLERRVWLAADEQRPWSETSLANRAARLRVVAAGG